MAIEGPGDSTEGNVQYRYNRFLKPLLQEQGISLDSNTKVLEVGSGNGLMLQQFKKDGIDAVGVDINPRDESGETLQVKARGEQLPLTDGSFNVVISTQAFDSAKYPDQDQKKMAAEIVRVLKEGGLYISFAEMMQDIPPGLTLISDSMDRWTTAVYKKQNTD
jgi:ubiquinone/menaquinone biosynthesis C-methylase UbiE